MQRTLAVTLLAASLVWLTIAPAPARANDDRDGGPKAATPIKYLVVIFDENNSFDHYFGTYPFATNPAGEPQFHPTPDTPVINGFTPVLLEHGANPNWHDDEGNTPLHRAIQSRLIVDPAEFVQLLLDAGADASIRNNAGRTPLEEAEALLLDGQNAETYFPVRSKGPKRLEQTIEILRSRLAYGIFGNTVDS